VAVQDLPRGVASRSATRSSSTSAARFRGRIRTCARGWTWWRWARWRTLCRCSTRTACWSGTAWQCWRGNSARRACALRDRRYPRGLGTADITYRLPPAERHGAHGRSDGQSPAPRSGQHGGSLCLARTLDDHNRQRQLIEEEVVQGAEAQIVQLYDWRSAGHRRLERPVAPRRRRDRRLPPGTALSPTRVVLTRDPSGQYTAPPAASAASASSTCLEQCKRSLVRFAVMPWPQGCRWRRTGYLSSAATSRARSVRCWVDAMRPQFDISGEVGLDELSDRFFAELERLQPFGHSNPEPLFLTRCVVPERRALIGKTHTKDTARHERRKLPFIFFGRTPEDFPEPPWMWSTSPR